MKVMFLDESGNHALDKIEPDYPVFVLGGVIVDRAYARDIITPRINQLKVDFFGREDLILHTADIIRAKNGFEALKDTGLRDKFYKALNMMMRDMDYKVVACVIKKDAHVTQYGANAADPYMYSLEVLVERFCREIGDVEDGGIIYSEKRNPQLDRQLDLAWRKLQTTGTAVATAQMIGDRIVDLNLRDKHLNIAGLQLADLVVSPIGRAVMGKPTRQDWEIVESKFRRHGTCYHGFGLVVLPE